MKRSAELIIDQGIQLPMGPPLKIIGKGKDGKAVCQLYINATGVSIAGPRGGVIISYDWENLFLLAQQEAG